MAKLLKDIPQEFKDLETTGDFRDRMDAEEKALEAIKARTYEPTANIQGMI